MATNVAYFLDDAVIKHLKNLASKALVATCCSDGYIFSLLKNQCLLVDEKKSSKAKRFLDVVVDGIRDGLVPATPFRLEKLMVADSWLHFWPNGTFCVENSTSAVCFQQGEYCFACVLEQNKLMLLSGTCLKEELGWMKLVAVGLKHLVFFVSLLLTLVTLAVYLHLPALRRKMFNKCIICHLISLTVTVVTIYVFMALGILNKIHDMVYCNLLRMFLILSNMFWLNVICFHLWRCVRSPTPKRKIKLLYYAGYAWGCPLMLIGVDLIEFRYDVQVLHELSKKWYALDRVASLIVLFTNLCLFLHIAVIIWRQKNQWKGNSESKRHMKKQQTRMWQILKLFCIMGILEWNHFFSCAYRLGVNHEIYTHVTNFLYLCPGYIIFMVFVCSNRTVIAVLKKKIHQPRTL